MNKTNNFSAKNVEAKKYYVIFTNPDDKIIELRWTIESEQMNAQEYKDVLLEMREYVKAHQPLYLIIDLKDLVFPLSHKLQNWMLEEIIYKGYLGFSKLALLMSEDMVTHNSVEQTFDKINSNMNLPFEVKYFTHPQEVKYWLIG